MTFADASLPARGRRRGWGTGLRAAAATALFAVVALAWTQVMAAAAPAEGFADLAERLLPAVVNISTTQVLKNPEKGLEMPQFPPGSPFEEFFKDFLERQGQLKAVPRKVTALGSGFIIDPSGLVVTNNHVIADADQITVILHSQKAYKAKVLGRDSRADLALLKIDAPGKLPFVTFGDSDKMRVGDWVLAIGNPFGLGGTVTAGIVSARSRDINAGPYDDFIQTDAAINKGNSGGPLLNLKGDVIGVNTAIYSPSGGSIGIGFSIPSNQVKPVIDDLRKYGRTRRGWIGVRIQSVTDEIAESLGRKDDKGALVASVAPEGPAAKAGVKPGDVILEFDGKSIDEMRLLPRVVAETPINQTVNVALWRDGKKITVGIKVAEMPEKEETGESRTGGRETPPQEKPHGEIALLGVSVAPISPAVRERFDLPADAKGVVVTDVTASGPAAAAGVRPGDVIVEVSQEAVASPADLAAKVAAARREKRKSVLLLVQNESGLHFVAVRIDGKTGKDGGD